MFYYIDSQENEVSVYFSGGTFDNYCVYVNEVPNMFRHAMKDSEYFRWILSLARCYGVVQVWDDFCRMYDIVSMDAKAKPDAKKAMAVAIENDSHYTEETIKWWLVFYMTMVAECKKENAILKKRIKKLGVYNVLIDEWDIDYVTTYMENKDNVKDWWKYLDELMKERGI